MTERTEKHDYSSCFAQLKDWDSIRTGSRQDFREFTVSDETLDEFRYAENKRGRSNRFLRSRVSSAVTVNRINPKMLTSHAVHFGGATQCNYEVISILNRVKSFAEGAARRRNKF